MRTKPRSTLITVLMCAASASLAQVPNDALDVDPERAYWIQRARERPERSAPELDPERVEGDLAGLIGLGETPDGLIGFGPGYHVRFTAGGPELFVAGEADVEATEVRVELASVTRGEHVLARPPAGARPFAWDGTTVTYPLGGGVAERYEIRPEGVELALVLDAPPPGVGDLVLRARVESDATAPFGEYPEGFRLERPGAATVRVGGAVGIDAKGRRVPGRVLWTGSELLCSLSEEFLASASYPLVLDPVMGPMTIANVDVVEADIAYDATRDVCGIAYQRRSDNLVLFARLSRSGYLLESGIGHPVGFNTSNPVGVSIANVNDGDWFVVGLANSFPNITLVSFNANWPSPAAGSVLVTTRQIWTEFITDFELGGELLPPFENLMLAYAERDIYAGSSVQTQRVRVNSAGQLSLVDSPAVVQYDAPGANSINNLSITKSGGGPGQWMLAFEEWGGNQTALIRALTVDYRNVRTSWPAMVAYGREPAVEGDGTRFAIAISISGCLPHDGKEILFARYERSGSNLIERAYRIFNFSSTAEEHNAAIAKVGDEYWISWVLGDPHVCGVNTGSGSNLVVFLAVDAMTLATRESHFAGDSTLNVDGALAMVGTQSGSLAPPAETATMVGWTEKPIPSAQLRTWWIR